MLALLLWFYFILVAAVERGFTEELSGRFLKVSGEKSFLAIVLFSKVQTDI